MLKTLVATLDWGLSMQDAIVLPNFVNRNGTTDLEAGTPLVELAPELERLGHDLRLRRLTSGLHGIRVTAQSLDGGADPRREGVVLTVQPR